MFFVVSKILGYFLSPVLWVFLLLLYGMFNRNRKRRKIALISSVVVLYLFSNSFIVGHLVKAWDVDGISYSQLDASYEVGIVLGGTTISYEKTIDRKIYHGNIDRLLQAVELYKSGRISKIMVTGGSGNLIYRDVNESALLHEFLKIIDVPEEDIIVEAFADNTHENAEFCKNILKQNDYGDKVLLITSSLHMRRAKACFDKEGLEVTAFSTNLISHDIRWNVEYLLLPDVINFKIWEAMMHETIGYMAYRMAGYV